MSAGPRAAPRLRLLPIDDGLAQALRDGAEAFGRRTGVRAIDAGELSRDVVEPSLALLARVLTKLGFRHTRAVTDPEDGLVWRWELPVSG